MFCHNFVNMPKIRSCGKSYNSSTLSLRLYSYIESFLCVQQKQFKQNQNFRTDNYSLKMGAYLSCQKNGKFFVLLCGDVLLDVLQFGNRRQLVKLERVGRRLHWMVENFYGGRPFLRLGLVLDLRFFLNNSRL